MTTYPFQTSYKKSVGKNFMIIDLEESYINESSCLKSFRLRMIHENIIPGLLNTHVQYINDLPSFQYDITGMQSLEVILDTTPLTYEFLCKIFLALYNTLLSIENYMLLHDHVLLSPEYIYMSADFSDIRLCYCPLKSDSLVDSIRTFFDYLLKKVNHDDEKCVYLAYSMHRCCCDIDFSLTKLYSQLSTVPKKNISATVYTSEDTSGNDITDTFTTSEDVDNYRNAFIKADNKTWLIKSVFLVSTLLILICAFSFMYMENYFNFEFYIILIVSLLVIGVYNSYNIHRQYGRTELETRLSQNNKTSYNKQPYRDTTPYPNTGNDSRTVILTSHADINSHKLIYTGTGDETDITLSHFPFVIGKTDSCSAILKNSAISRLHAKLSISYADNDSGDNNEDIFIEDLNSTNGTLLNSEPLTPYERYPVNSGDHITFGHLTYIFR